jgi:hypothetical protein
VNWILLNDSYYGIDDLCIRINTNQTFEEFFGSGIGFNGSAFGTFASAPVFDHIVFAPVSPQQGNRRKSIQVA